MEMTKAESSVMNQLGLPIPLVTAENGTGGGDFCGTRGVITRVSCCQKSDEHGASQDFTNNKGEAGRSCALLTVAPAGNSQQPF